MSCARAIAWRGTEASESDEGPSMRACVGVSTCASNIYLFALLITVHTRLWSMISTMVASFPSDGPPWMRTTRPTSTSLHDEALISASPILIDAKESILAAVSRRAIRD